MPILEDDDMDDRALLWEALGEGADGQFVHDEPVEIFVDYRIKRTIMRSVEGLTFVVDGTVTLPRRVALGSNLWFAPDHRTSAFTQWYSSSGSGGQRDEVMRVEVLNVTRDAKKIETRITAGIVWDRDRGGGY